MTITFTKDCTGLFHDHRHDVPSVYASEVAFKAGDELVVDVIVNECLLKSNGDEYTGIGPNSYRIQPNNDD